MNAQQAFLVEEWHMDSWSGNEVVLRLFKTEQQRDSFIIETNKDLGKGAVPEYYVRANRPARNKVMVDVELFNTIDDVRGKIVKRNDFYV